MTELWTGCSTCETEKCNVNLVLVLTCPLLPPFGWMPVQGSLLKCCLKSVAQERRLKMSFSGQSELLNWCGFLCWAVWLYKHICPSRFNTFDMCYVCLLPGRLEGPVWSVAARAVPQLCLSYSNSAELGDISCGWKKLLQADLKCLLFLWGYFALCSDPGWIFPFTLLPPTLLS